MVGGLLVLAATLGPLAAFGWSRAHLADAEQALQRSDLDEAQRHLDQILRAWPWNARARFLAARAARRRDAHGDAERLLTAYERSQGQTAESRFEWTLLGVQQGDFAGQERALQGMVDQGHADSPLILEALAKGYFNTRDGPLMLHCLDRLLKVEPGHVPALLWRARGLEGPDDALTAYQRAVEVAPDSDEAQLGLAAALDRLGRPREAVYHIEIVRRRHPDNPAALLGLARCRFDAAEPEEAERLLDALLAAHPDHVAGLVERGRLALRRDRLADAEEWLTRATDLAPWHREAHQLLLVGLEAQAKSDKARRCQERMREHEARDREMVRLRLLFRADARDQAVRYAIGRWCLENGEDKAGVRWLCTALLADAGHGPTHAALADYFERDGQPRRAAWHRAQAKR
jgi:tetratricopeptide (TPR) repeat protein